MSTNTGDENTTPDTEDVEGHRSPGPDAGPEGFLPEGQGGEGFKALAFPDEDDVEGHAAGIAPKPEYEDGFAPGTGPEGEGFKAL